MLYRITFVLFVMSVFFTPPAIACQASAKAPAYSLYKAGNAAPAFTLSESNLASRLLAGPGFCLGGKISMAERWSKKPLVTNLTPERYIILVSDTLKPGYNSRHTNYSATFTE